MYLWEHCQLRLIDELFNDGYAYIIPRKLQSDMLANCFFSVLTNEFFSKPLRDEKFWKDISLPSLLLENINLWMEDLSPDVLHTSFNEFAKFNEGNDSHISHFDKG